MTAIDPTEIIPTHIDKAVLINNIWWCNKNYSKFIYKINSHNFIFKPGDDPYIQIGKYTCTKCGIDTFIMYYDVQFYQGSYPIYSFYCDYEKLSCNEYAINTILK